MVLPIRAYGDPILHKKAEPVAKDDPGIQPLIDDMIETMRSADGAGLAAPQIGKSSSVFVADLTQALSALPEEERPKIPTQPMVCINPEIVYQSKEEAEFEEGCLSIPNLNERVKRPYKVTLRYLDRSFKTKKIEGIGPLASVLQHENDHLDGVLYIDYLSGFRKKIIQRRLDEISQGAFDAKYPMQIGDHS